MMVAMMSKAVPEDAQGELQGGISAVMNIAMLFGTVTFAQVFSTFMQEDASWQTPDAAFFLAGVLLVGVLALFVAIVKRPKAG